MEIELSGVTMDDITNNEEAIIETIASVLGVNSSSITINGISAIDNEDETRRRRLADAMAIDFTITVNYLYFLYHFKQI